ncbi:arrestin [Didymella exigua CBS 183.55]|uniref:Arrestin n=1 Tax=Didymella exigua CBS 183.55 TaxID=1150837 RepID=A0A6A5RG61_9PLEO|nr:arrestin [Didymella exigua CBS 183.55]KAF1926260.1 arrestin [Didymella exigua CBS 183.55]
MPSSSRASISSGFRTHPISSVGNQIVGKARTLANMGQPNIEFVMNDSDGPRRIIPSYSTMDTISGYIEITAPSDTRFEDIDIAFIGTANTFVDRVTTTPSLTGRTESSHRFLTLRQPVDQSSFSTPRVFEAGRVYKFPFTFNIPERLLPKACTHNVVADPIRDQHLMLPPSFGDPDLSGFGSALLDDLAPEMSKITYGVKVRIAQRGLTDNVIHILAERLKKVRVKPAFEEQAPLNIDGIDEYRSKQEKTIKKGLFKGRLGTLTAQTMQPAPFSIPGARTTNNKPIATIAKLVLRFDPAEEGTQPPALNSLHTKLKATTFYASNPRHNLPSRTHMAFDMSQGVYAQNVALNSLCITKAKWESHSMSSNPAPESLQRRDSGISDCSTSSSAAQAFAAGILSPSSNYKNGTFYTACILVPVTLTEKKNFVPTFHTCLISRIYTLKFEFTPQGGSSMSLKVPVQICADGSDTGIENARARSVEAVMYRASAGMFEPRSVAPPNFDGSVSVQRDDLPPDYSAFAPATRLAVRPQASI